MSELNNVLADIGSGRMSKPPKYDLDPVRSAALERLIPAHMQGGLLRYLQYGIAPGHFLKAVLSNDLQEAVGRADESNINALPDYVRFLYNYAPMGAWGSPEAYKNWLGND